MGSVLGILSLSVLHENARGNLRYLMHQAERFVLCNLLSLGTEIIQSAETWVLPSANTRNGNNRFTKDTMSITWDNSSRFQSLP